LALNYLVSQVSKARPGAPGIIGTWHRISAKHLAAYLDEMEFRFNNRSNPYLFHDSLMKLIEAPVLEYKKLTAA
jgi:hypothetical protein